MTKYPSILAVAVLVAAAGCGDQGNTTSSAGTAARSPDAIAAEIKRLEQLEVEAVLARDTATLAKLWDAQYVVNNPDNQIVVATPDPRDRPVLQQPRAAFTRQVEHITVQGDVVVSMGSETVVPAGDRPQAGETVKRRYTNIWKLVDGTWKLIARHANVIRDPR